MQSDWQSKTDRVCWEEVCCYSGTHAVGPRSIYGEFNNLSPKNLIVRFRQNEWSQLQCKHSPQKNKELSIEKINKDYCHKNCQKVLLNNYAAIKDSVSKPLIAQKHAKWMILQIMIKVNMFLTYQ